MKTISFHPEEMENLRRALEKIKESKDMQPLAPSQLTKSVPINGLPSILDIAQAQRVGIENLFQAMADLEKVLNPIIVQGCGTSGESPSGEELNSPLAGLLVKNNQAIEGAVHQIHRLHQAVQL
jgi:hypothetical protein